MINEKDYKENIIKISFDTNVKNAVSYTIMLFEKKKYDSVVLCGLSLAISKVILIAEVVKTKIKNLHQINNIDCLMAKDKFNADVDKRVPKLDIILTTKEPLNKGNGYQEPMSEEEVDLLASIKNLNLEVEENSDEKEDENYDENFNEQDEIGNKKIIKRNVNFNKNRNIKMFKKRKYLK